MSDEKGLNDDSDQEEYSFLTEKIKKRPIYKNRIIRKLLSTAILAVLFGAVACGTFYLLSPWMEEKFKKEESDKVVFQNEDEEKQEDETAAEESQTDQTQQLELSDYERIYKELYYVAQDSAKSVVTVTGINNSMELFDKTYDNQRNAAGLIIAKTSQELLILSEQRVAEEVEEIKVTFSNGAILSANIKKFDNNTGFIILSIPIEQVNYNDVGEIVVAETRNSNSVIQGEPVIALGSPLGYNDSVNYGFITSTGNSVQTIDANYSLLTTDIAADSSGSGVLVDVNGKVIGIITQRFSSNENQNIVTCMGITDVLVVAEYLSNGQDIPYIGIKGITVTNDVNEQTGMPKGVYVTEVVTEDSPAMTAGIQKGDIITGFNGSKIKTMGEFQMLLLKTNPKDEVTLKAMREGADGYVEISYKVSVGVY